MIEFRLNYKITAKDSTNAIYKSGHWGNRYEKANYFHLAVKSAIRSQVGFHKMFDTPVMIEMHFKSRLDLDNHSYLSKMIIDGMKGELIQDDTRKYVKGLCVFFLEDSDESDIIVRVGE